MLKEAWLSVRGGGDAKVLEEEARLSCLRNRG